MDTHIYEKCPALHYSNINAFDFIDSYGLFNKLAHLSSEIIQVALSRFYTVFCAYRNNTTNDKYATCEVACTGVLHVYFYLHYFTDVTHAKLWSSSSM